MAVQTIKIGGQILCTPGKRNVGNERGHENCACVVVRQANQHFLEVGVVLLGEELALVLVVDHAFGLGKHHGDAQGKASFPMGGEGLGYDRRPLRVAFDQLLLDLFETLAEIVDQPLLGFFFSPSWIVFTRSTPQVCGISGSRHQPRSISTAS